MIWKVCEIEVAFGYFTAGRDENCQMDVWH